MHIEKAYFFSKLKLFSKWNLFLILLKKYKNLSIISLVLKIEKINFIISVV